jgi:hypothetical protein
LRPHSTKNAHQHQATLDQLVLPYPEEWRSYQQWFKDLPLFLEIDGLRVVHAAWDENAIRLVRGRSFYDPDFLAAAATRGTPEFTAVETLLKGPETRIPDGQMCVELTFKTHFFAHQVDDYVLSGATMVRKNDASNGLRIVY